jgi:4'-phosphopantetheinyl transferase
MWHYPPEKFALQQNEVHIWKAKLDVDPILEQKLWHLLSNDEKLRANRFRFQIDRLHYISARGILRSILGRYLNMRSAEVYFRYGQQGKPALSPEHELKFNISHSGGLSLFALTLNKDIGIDLEKINEEIEIDSIANRFFAPGEVKRLFSLPQKDQTHAFFQCWTRKEAFIKAKGDGLSFPLDQFEVSFGDPGQGRLLKTKWDIDEVNKWHLTTFDPEEGFTGALAVYGTVNSINQFLWDKHLQFK